MNTSPLPVIIDNENLKELHETLKPNNDEVQQDDPNAILLESIKNIIDTSLNRRNLSDRFSSNNIVNGNYINDAQKVNIVKSEVDITETNTIKRLIKTIENLKSNNDDNKPSRMKKSSGGSLLDEAPEGSSTDPFYAIIKNFDVVKKQENKIQNENNYSNNKSIFDMIPDIDLSRDKKNNKKPGKKNIDVPDIDKNNSKQPSRVNSKPNNVVDKPTRVKIQDIDLPDKATNKTVGTFIKNASKTGFNIVKNIGTKIPLVGSLIAAGFAGYDAVSGYNDDASIQKALGKDTDKITENDRLNNSVVSAATGFLDSLFIPQIASVFSDKTAEEIRNNIKESTLKNVVKNSEINEIQNDLAEGIMKTFVEAEKQKYAPEIADSPEVMNKIFNHPDFKKKVEEEYNKRNLENKETNDISKKLDESVNRLSNTTDNLSKTTNELKETSSKSIDEIKNTNKTTNETINETTIKNNTETNKSDNKNSIDESINKFSRTVDEFNKVQNVSSDVNNKLTDTINKSVDINSKTTSIDNKLNESVNKLNETTNKSSINTLQSDINLNESVNRLSNTTNDLTNTNIRTNTSSTSIDNKLNESVNKLNETTNKSTNIDNKLTETQQLSTKISQDETKHVSELIKENTANLGSDTVTNLFKTTMDKNKIKEETKANNNMQQNMTTALNNSTNIMNQTIINNNGGGQSSIIPINMTDASNIGGK